MIRSRSVVAALFLLLFTQTAAGDCLRPAWESRPLLPAAGTFRTTMVLDDFDGDGIDDVILIRANAANQTATFQRGRGSGFFAAPADLYTSAPASIHSPRGLYHAVAKDLNGDGKLDLLLLENLVRLVFLPGNGDGTFADPLFSPAVVGELFAVADLTGDNIDDVVAFHYVDGFGVVLFSGTGAGTFAESRRIPLPAPPRAIAAGDLDGDGANDIVAGYGEPSNLAVLFGNDDGTFDPALTRANGDSWAVTIKLADLENDGDLDIVAENHFDRLAVHRNRGGRTFDAATIYPVTEPYTSIYHQLHATIADVTGDGELDLLATTSNKSLATLRGRGDGTFEHPHFELFDGSSRTMAPIGTTDFDGDGRVDVIIGQNNFGGLHALRNRCGEVTVTFRATPLTIAAGQQSVTAQVAIHGHDEGLEEPPPVHPTGTVSILDGATVRATGTLSNGEVTLEVRGLAPGAHKLVAHYSGDDQYEPAQSARIIVRVTVSSEPATPPPPRRRATRR